MTRPLLADAFEHHVWATLRLIDACVALPEQDLATTVPGTFGSILDTMRHLVGGDRSYLALLSGGRVAAVDENAMDVAQLRAVMQGHNDEWARLIARELDPDAIVIRYRDDGTESGAPLGARIAQVLHHGTDHRSQVCTALTSIGVDPPAIDVWDYAASQGRLTEVRPARG